MANAGQQRTAFLLASLFMVAVAAILALLALPLTAAIGPFYWDTFIYYDAVARIADGQVPIVDFHAPVGPLGYWLFAALHAVFPHGQGVYMASWAILLVTGPLMALIAHETALRYGSLVAAALAIPFLVFSVLPFNVEQFYPYPGIDGYGIYNRQISQLLYVLVAGLLFVERPWMRIAVVAASLAALFLTKITGFLVAPPLVLLAILGRRLSLGQALAALAIFALTLGTLELWSGLTDAYLRGIVALVSVNDGSLLLNLVHGAARNITTIAGFGLLILALTWSSRHRLSEILADLKSSRFAGSLRDFASLEVIWLIAVVVGGILLESQNWGGQAFLFVWPALLACFLNWARWNEPMRLAVAVLAAVAMLPAYVSLGGRALRTYMAQMQYDRVDIPGLGELDSVSKRAGIDQRVALIRTSSIEHPDYFHTYMKNGELPFFTYYAQPEFQLAWLKSIGEGVNAIREYEEANGVHFSTILSLNFVNPFPYLLGRSAPKAVTIGQDPFRTLPPHDNKTRAEIGKTDLVLWPKCPVTVANQRIREHYEPMLQNHETISLSECWDGLVPANDN